MLSGIRRRSLSGKSIRRWDYREISPDPVAGGLLINLAGKIQTSAIFVIICSQVLRNPFTWSPVLGSGLIQVRHFDKGVDFFVSGIEYPYDSFVIGICAFPEHL
jgi:hypothetical protein